MFIKIKNNSIKGIVFMLFAAFCFAINDTLVKYAVKDIDDDQALFYIVFVRGIFTSIFILISIYFYGKINFKKIFYDKRSYMRGMCEVGAAFCFLTSLMIMPMADVYTLLNTAPLIITAAGAILLKEKVGIRRWSAVIIGFIGVLIVINPVHLKFGYIFILPISAAIFLTIKDVITKNYKDSSNSLEIIFITSLLVTIGFGLISLFFPTTLDFKTLLIISTSSIFLTFAYLLSVLTIIYAPLSTTSAARYSVVVFGMILGYIFFSEIPSTNMIIGAVIISFSGLFIIKREKDLQKIKH